ncbi:nucleoside hydrolase [Agromyces sp. GXQ0307]|uniref:nucleoside hydrolase n=1 Tax=Agromyces sp. GXQ0307 TaxID=3377835 RepID=UPI00383B8968
MVMMNRQIVLDVDTGNDDAVAIAMAAGRSGLDVLACTTVRGNLPLEETTDNTLRMLGAIGRPDIPVYAGLGRPFAPRPYPFAPGRSAGLMHESVLPLPPSTRTAESTSAIDWLIATLRATTQPITIVALAPLTNIAAAATAAPEIVDAIDEIVIMGGGHEFGNRTPAAEFNIYADPIAADVVFQAGFQRVTVMPLDATHDVVTDRAMIEQIRALGTDGAAAVAAVLDFYIAGHDASHPMDSPASAPVHDALCVSYLMDPEVVDLRHVAVSVDTTGFQNFGRTTVDVNHRGNAAPNVWWGFSADQARFDRTVLESLRA